MKRLIPLVFVLAVVCAWAITVEEGPLRTFVQGLVVQERAAPTRIEIGHGAVNDVPGVRGFDASDLEIGGFELSGTDTDRYLGMTPETDIAMNPLNSFLRHSINVEWQPTGCTGQGDCPIHWSIVLQFTGTSATLPECEPGVDIRYTQATGATLTLYPASGDRIGTTNPVDTGIPVPDGLVVDCTCGQIGGLGTWGCDVLKTTAFNVTDYSGGNTGDAYCDSVAIGYQCSCGVLFEDQPGNQFLIAQIACVDAPAVGDFATWTCTDDRLSITQCAP